MTASILIYQQFDIPNLSILPLLSFTKHMLDLVLGITRQTLPTALSFPIRPTLVNLQTRVPAANLRLPTRLALPPGIPVVPGLDRMDRH